MATGARARPATAGSRGPARREPTLSPTGYRVSDRQRFELRMAALFIGEESLQDVIDFAVTGFLGWLRAEFPKFGDAVEDAEHAQQQLAGVQSLVEAAPWKMRKH